jgi:hypothetical protein
MSNDPNPVVTHSKRAKFEDVGSACVEPRFRHAVGQ